MVHLSVPSRDKPVLDEILTVIREVLSPMVEADGGSLHLVAASEAHVSLHLSGRCAGCPGNEVAVRRVFLPAIQAVAPNIKLDVTWGRIVPEGATPVVPASH